MTTTPSLKRVQRLMDCGLSSSVYQRCFYYDDINNNKKVVKFYIGDDEVEQDEWFPEEECVSGLTNLLTDNLLYHLKLLFDIEVVGLVDVVPEIVRQVLHLSESEPYGVRGTNVIVNLERPCYRTPLSRKSSGMSTTSSSSSVLSSDTSGGAEPEVLNLGHIKMCKDTVTTFDLILMLKAERNLGLSVRNWMANLVGSKQIIVIESNFTLRKKRLYRSN